MCCVFDCEQQQCNGMLAHGQPHYERFFPRHAWGQWSTCLAEALVWGEILLEQQGAHPADVCIGASYLCLPQLQRLADGRGSFCTGAEAFNLPWTVLVLYVKLPVLFWKKLEIFWICKYHWKRLAGVICDVVSM